MKKFKEFCLWALAMLIILTIVAVINIFNFFKDCFEKIKKALICLKGIMLIAVNNMKKGRKTFFRYLVYINKSTFRNIKTLCLGFLVLTIALCGFAYSVKFNQEQGLKKDVNGFYTVLESSFIKLEKPKDIEEAKAKLFKVLDNLDSIKKNFSSEFKSVTYISLTEFKKEIGNISNGKFEEIIYSSILPLEAKKAAKKFLEARNNAASPQKLLAFKEVTALQNQVLQAKPEIIKALAKLSSSKSLTLEKVKKLNVIVKEYGNTLTSFHNKMIDFREVIGNKVSINVIDETDISPILLAASVSFVIMTLLMFIGVVLYAIKLLNKFFAKNQF